MPAASPHIGKKVQNSLRDLGQFLRDRRKALGVSATTTAEAAGISRITLYRIEKGEPSVTLGAYFNVVISLGLQIELFEPGTTNTNAESKSPPKVIRVKDFKQLKQLAWQIKDSTELSPEEAFHIYERNWRHIDLKKMNQKEKTLLEMLLKAFGREKLRV